MWGLLISNPKCDREVVSKFCMPKIKWAAMTCPKTCNNLLHGWFLLYTGVFVFEFCIKNCPGSEPLVPVRRQAITWTNAALLSIWLVGTDFSEIWVGIHKNAFKNVVCQNIGYFVQREMELILLSMCVILIKWYQLIRTTLVYQINISSDGWIICIQNMNPM